RLSKSFERVSKRSNELFCTYWNFGPGVNLVRTSLDVVRTKCYVSRTRDQLSQSRLNDVRTNFFVLTGILAPESILFERAWMSFER
ncbi:hypothetical protein GIB67_013425, partial [Kingdonia uniflora]